MSVTRQTRPSRRCWISRDGLGPHPDAGSSTYCVAGLPADGAALLLISRVTTAATGNLLEWSGHPFAVLQQPRQRRNSTPERKSRAAYRRPAGRGRDHGDPSEQRHGRRPARAQSSIRRRLCRALERPSLEIVNRPTRCIAEDFETAIAPRPAIFLASTEGRPQSMLLASVIGPTGRLGKAVETALDQYRLQTVVKHMTRRARHLRPAYHQVPLTILLLSHRHQRIPLQARTPENQTMPTSSREDFVNGLIGDTVPLAVGKWCDFHEFGWYMGNVG